MIHSYPWYMEDWRGSQARLMLNLEERALYRELLDFCYIERSLPTDERMLARIANCSDDEFKRTWPSVQKLFNERNGRYYNQKVNQVLERLDGYHEQKRKAGRASGERRRNGKGTGVPPALVSVLPKKATENEPTLTSLTSSTSLTSPPSSTTARPHGEFPETAAAVRAGYPETNDAFIMKLTIAVGQMAAGQNGKLKGDPTDALIADAVRHCARASPKQNSAGLYLQTVPQCVCTWLTQGKLGQPNKNPIFNPADYGLTK